MNTDKDKKKKIGTLTKLCFFERLLKPEILILSVFICVHLWFQSYFSLFVVLNHGEDVDAGQLSAAV
jgi:hypothetical protein